LYLADKELFLCFVQVLAQVIQVVEDVTDDVFRHVLDVVSVKAECQAAQASQVCRCQGAQLRYRLR
jgi:hypothetical protein